MRRFIIDLQEPKLPSPPKPTAPTKLSDEDDSSDDVEYQAELESYEADLEVWKEEVKLIAKRRLDLKCSILPSVYVVVWRQCTLEMKELLKSTDIFNAIDEANDVIGLLRLIRASTVVDQRSQHPALSVLQAMNNFSSFRQLNLSNEVYLEGFRDRVNILEDISGTMIGCDNVRVGKEYGGSIEDVSASDPVLVAARKKCRDKFMAIAFIEHADKKRYGDLQTSMSNDYLRKKNDEYPSDLTHAVEILNKWKGNQFRGRNPNFSPMFLQQDDNRGGHGKRGGRGGGKRHGSDGSPTNTTNDSINPYLCVSSRATTNVGYAVNVCTKKIKNTGRNGGRRVGRKNAKKKILLGGRTSHLAESTANQSRLQTCFDSRLRNR